MSAANDSQWHPQTKAIHAGQRFDPTTGSVITPIHQTAAYQFDDARHAESLFMLQGVEDGQHQNIYSRMGNPTVDQFEARITALDCGLGAVGFGSGMAAITAAVLNVCRQGDNFVASQNLYGGVSNLFRNIFKNFGIECRIVDHSDPENFRLAADDKTRLFWGETLPNPRLNVFPIGEVAKIGDEMGIPLFIDNTCATPALCRPFEHGAHVAVYSATKYLCGHGTSIGGVVVDSGKFDWEAAGARLPMLNEPDPSLHGINWAGKFGQMGYLAKLRVTMLRDLGATLAPLEAFLFTTGLETLHLRMAKHCENASKVAGFLANHPKVNNVQYPELAEGNTRRWADQYMGGQYGGMVGLDVKGGIKGGQTVAENLKLFYHVANIGDVRSMAIHPASTTHSQVPSEMRAQSGITDGYVRLCIGIEDANDIIADLDQALSKVAV